MLTKTKVYACCAVKCTKTNLNIFQGRGGMVRWIRLALIQCKKNVITQNRIKTRFKKFCDMPFQNALFAFLRSVITENM